MDQVLFSPPEIFQSDMEEPQSGSLSSSHFFPHYLQLISTSQQELDLHQPTEPFLQETPGPSTVAQMLQRRANPHEGSDSPSWTQMDSNQRCVRNLFPSVTGPFQHGPQDCVPFLNVCPPSLSLQASPPGPESHPGLTPLYPELMLTPCFPHDPCWPNMSPVLFCCSPCSPPHSWLLLPEVHPGWCACPQALHVHEPCSPDPVSRGTTPAGSGRGQLEEQAEPEGQRSRMDRKGQGDEEQNNITLKGTKSKVSPGSLPWLDEKSMAERAFEEYMTIINSLGPKALEDEEDEDEEEKLAMGNSSFLEYMDELCSNENFVREVWTTLNTKYLDSLLSSDPEPIDLLSLEKPQQEVILVEHQPSADAIFNPVTDGTPLVCDKYKYTQYEELKVESTLNTEYLNPPLSPDPDPIDLLSQRELLLEIVNVIQQQLADLPADDADSVTPVTQETAPGTSRVEEPAPLRNAPAPVPDPPGSQSNTSPNQDGQKTPPRNAGPREGWTISSPLPPSHLLEAQTENLVNASTSPLNHGESLFMDFIASLQLHAKISPDAGLTSASEARDDGSLVETPAAAKSEEASMSLSNLGDTRSAQASQRPQEGPLPGDPPASESPSTPSVAGANEDPCTATVEDPAPGFRVDAPPAPSVLALKTRPRPLPPTREPSGPCGLININANSCSESNADSCDPPADVILSDSASSELRAGQRGEADSEAATRKQTATKAREERSTKKTPGRKEENKENETSPKGTTKARRSQRLLGQTEKPKAILKDELIERAVSEKESKRDGEVYEKQKRRSSGGRQLFKREESHFENEMQKLKEEGREQREASDPDVSSETGAGSVPPTKIPQEETEFGEGAQMSSFVTEQPTPLSAIKARGKVKPSEEEEGKSSPKTEVQDDGKVEVKVKEEEAGRQILTGLSPIKSSRDGKEKTGEDKASPTEPSPQSPKVQPDTRSTKDSMKESSGEEPPVEGRESSSVRSREIKTSLNSAPGPEGQRRSQTVAGSGAESKRGDFYSSRSQHVSQGTRATSQPAGDGINGGEEAEPQSLATSPTKRHRHPRANGTETIDSSPTKRGRWRSRAEVKTEPGEEETSGCKWSPPSTRSGGRAKDASGGRVALEGGDDAIGTRRQQTRFSTKLPTKYKDFILRKSNRHKRPPGKEEGKERGRRGRKR